MQAVITERVLYFHLKFLQAGNNLLQSDSVRTELVGIVHVGIADYLNGDARIFFRKKPIEKQICKIKFFFVLYLRLSKTPHPLTILFDKLPIYWPRQSENILK